MSVFLEIQEMEREQLEFIRFIIQWRVRENARKCCYSSEIERKTAHIKMYSAKQINTDGKHLRDPFKEITRRKRHTEEFESQ